MRITISILTLLLAISAGSQTGGNPDLVHTENGELRELSIQLPEIDFDPYESETERYYKIIDKRIELAENNIVEVESLIKERKLRELVVQPDSVSTPIDTTSKEKVKKGFIKRLIDKIK